MLNVHAMTVRRYVDSGELSCVRLGRRRTKGKPRGIRIKRSVVDAFLKKRTT